MIKLQDLTPAIYYKQSRDFQFIGRLYDIVLNYVKTGAENLYNLPIGQNMNEQLLNLLALTLGFKTNKQYNSKQLLAICGALPTILKHKGSIQALVLATNALLAAEGVKQPLDYTLIPKQGIKLYIAQELDDLTLFTDLLDYLLPAGLSCTIIKESQLVTKVETVFTVTSSVKINGIDANDTDRENNSYYDVLESNMLSTIQPLYDLSDTEKVRGSLARGEVGTAPSILSNTTVVANPSKIKIGGGKTEDKGENEDE